jgi:hypothetical protein
MIDDVDNNNLKIIDPHQDPDTINYNKLNEIGKGGIGWVNINDIIFKNIDSLGMNINKNEYLDINTPTFYIIELI